MFFLKDLALIGSFFAVKHVESWSIHNCQQIFAELLHPTITGAQPKQLNRKLMRGDFYNDGPFAWFALVEDQPFGDIFDTLRMQLYDIGDGCGQRLHPAYDLEHIRYRNY